MTPHRTTFDTQPIRRSPWIVIVDAALPVVPSFWAMVDLGNAVVGRLARHGSRHLGSPGFPGAAR
jgi:hypothetical protein